MDFNTNNTTVISQNNIAPEQPETLEQKRNNVIEKINNLVDLDAYVQKKKIKLEELNDEEFDLLIYAIEHSGSVQLINYILNNIHYETLNYSFFDNGNYKSFFVSVMDKQIEYKGYKTPLFSAIASNKFRIADFLLKREANINYKINQGEYKDVDIINYLYFMSGFKDFLNRKNLKYILNNGFNIRQVTTDLINKMVNRNYSDGLLEIILKHFIYDNAFIIRLLTVYKNRVALTTEQIQNVITDEKRKIDIDESVYENADERENYDAINMILDYDGSGEESITEKIEDYELFERAVEYDRTSLVKKILSYEFIDLEQLNIENALSEASKNINVEMLKLLLDSIEQRKASFDIQSINFETILAETSRYHHMHYMDEERVKHIEIMKLLIEALFHISLERPENFDISLIKTFNPSYFNLIINIIIKIGHIQLMRYLLENEELKNQIDIDVKDKNKDCPLMTAYHTNNMEVFQYLINYGANCDIIVKEDGTSLLSLAIQNKNYKAVQCLLKQDVILMADKVTEDSSPLIKLVQQNDPESIIAFLDNDENEPKENSMGMPVSKDKNLNLPGYGFTPLILAYLRHYQDIFKVLIQHKDINELDSNGYSILHYAIIIEDIDTVIQLIKMGADLSYKEENKKRGNSALDIAISIENEVIFNILLNCPQIELNNPDWRGETSLMTIIKLNQIKLEDKIKVIKKLIERGSDVNFVDSSKNNALIYAVNEKLLPVAEQLIEHGADVNFLTAYDNTPLVYAVEKRNLPMVKLLVNHGADINFHIENKNKTIIMYAIELGAVDIVKYLIDIGSDLQFSNLSIFFDIVEAINKNGQKEIFEYIAQKHIELFTPNIVNEIISWDRLDLLKILVQNHLDVNIRDDNGNIPLVYAIKFNERQITNYLIENGANIFNINNAGQTIYDICNECLDVNSTSSISIHAKIKRLIEERKNLH